jgi:hypothetical protein
MEHLIWIEISPIREDESSNDLQVLFTNFNFQYCLL